MNHNVVIEKDSIMLRQITIDDIEKLRIWRNNPNNCKYLSKIPYISDIMQRNWFFSYLNNPDSMMFAIVEKNSLKRIVGSVCLYNFHEKSVELGKLLIGDDEAHGKKIGYNTVLALVEYCFIKLDIKRIFLTVFEDNKVALKIYKDVGFKVVEKRLNNSMIEYLMEYIKR